MTCPVGDSHHRRELGNKNMGSAADSGVRPFVYIPLFVFVACWSLLLLATIQRSSGPNPHAFGGDFAMFYSAARVVTHGGNPYDQRVLYREELSTFGSVHAVPQREYLRVGTAPLALYALIPLAALPFGLAASMWMCAMYLLCVLGFLAL